MFSEVLLDLFPFSGTENIIEVCQGQPFFKDACLKRGNTYQNINVEKLPSVTNADLFIFIANLDNFKKISDFLNRKKAPPFHFVLIAENKYNFHKICDFFEGVTPFPKKNLTLSCLEKSLYCINNMKKYQVFQDLMSPIDIRELGTRHENYLISHSSRVKNKRKFSGIISVLFELIFMRFLQVSSLAPAYVFINEKKMRLLSHNVHQNNISVFYAPEDRKYYKIASDATAVAKLKQEVRGWDWYLKNILIQDDTIEILLDKPSYYKFGIRKFLGKQVSYTDSFEKNFVFIEEVVDWYIRKWPKGGKNLIHGDLTLDNVIFGDNQEIYLIDWECFSEAKAFWGYDILYFILSTVFLPNKCISIPSKKDLNCIGNLFLKLFDNGVANKILETPLASIYQVIEKYLLPQNPGLSKDKFFPLWCSELEIDVMDECFVRAYRYAAYNKYLKELKDV